MQYVYTKWTLLSLMLLLCSGLAGCNMFEKASSVISISGGVVVSRSIVDLYASDVNKSERITQALYNEKVTVLEENGQWTKVAVEDGSVGWVETGSLVKNEQFTLPGEEYSKVIVTDKVKTVRAKPEAESATISEVVMGTEMIVKSRKSGWYMVFLPGNKTGWISTSGIIEVKKGGKADRTSASDFISTLMQFKGTKYLVGGKSYLGFDDSGLLYISARLNGVNLPRNTEGQMKFGTPAAKEDLKPGDLLFFRTDEGKPPHAGVYIGEGKFIHASVPYVDTDNIEDALYKNRFIEARRVFQ